MFLIISLQIEDKKWNYQTDEAQSGDGTVILNADFIIIPDEVIINSDYIENVNGITYVLSYNNAKPNPPYLYVEFWNRYLEEEQPSYKQIEEDIQHNEGPNDHTYITTFRKNY